MQRPPVLSILITLAAMLEATGAARATVYADNPNSTCRLMRNAAPGTPYLPEPNRADYLAAMPLAGTVDRLGFDGPEIRRRYAQAFPILQKIDAEGTTALAALPPDTPRIDLIIDRHVENLIRARAMLAIFYEQGRASPVDYAQAGAFYRKSVETSFTDDRGCVHSWPPATSVLTHLAGYYAYGVGVPHDPAKARELLLQAGDATARALIVLIDHDALPGDIEGYLGILANPTRLADRAAAAEHPPAAPDVPDIMTWLTDPDAAMAAMAAPVKTAMTWAGLIAALLIAGLAALWFVAKRRARLEQRSALYRTAFAVYDVIGGIAGRIGLVMSGVIGCGFGLVMLLQGWAFGFGPLDLIVMIAGGASLVGGIAKLIEAFRVSHAPKDTKIHGAARPAEEPEAQAAARGAPGASSLRDRTFKD